jgi:hypothetical protein
MIFFVALVLIKCNPHSSIISALFVALIFNYFNGLSLSSIGGACSPYDSTTVTKSNFLHSSLFHIIVSTTIALISIFSFTITKPKSENAKAMKITKEEPEQGENNPDVENPYTTENKLQVNKNEDIDFGGVQDDRPEKLLDELNEFLVFHCMMFLFCFYLGNFN